MVGKTERKGPSGQAETAAQEASPPRSRTIPAALKPTPARERTAPGVVRCVVRAGGVGVCALKAGVVEWMVVVESFRVEQTKLLSAFRAR